MSAGVVLKSHSGLAFSSRDRPAYRITADIQRRQKLIFLDQNHEIIQGLMKRLGLSHDSHSTHRAKVDRYRILATGYSVLCQRVLICVACCILGLPRVADHPGNSGKYYKEIQIREERM